ncbi:MAG: sigma 54-interacting transcriptional regulator, partial [Verrucomicrobiales bacterium]
ESESLTSQDFLKSGIATKSKAFNALIQRIETVVLRSTAPILLSGPTEAGKFQLAKRVYELRQQRRDLNGAFVEVNCATLSGDTALSTLFGHVKGTFTDAQRDRSGLLREAHGGLLFLDEIGELGPDEQAMLLRALEERVFLPFGGDQPVKSDFQLIAGTNRDLQQRVHEGKFREDLLARINLWHFTFPSLADRREDLEPNIDYELNLFARKEDRDVTFNKEARERFLKFARSPEASWKANFRDLNAAMTRIATLAQRGRISVREVDEEIARLQSSWQPQEKPEGRDKLCRAILGEERFAELDPFDRVQLGYVIEVCRQSNSISDAGRKLFVNSRSKRAKPNDADRLRKYLARLELDWPTVSRP